MENTIENIKERLSSLQNFVETLLNDNTDCINSAYLGHIHAHISHINEMIDNMQVDEQKYNMHTSYQKMFMEIIELLKNLDKRISELENKTKE